MKLVKVCIIALAHLFIFVPASIAQFQYRFENIGKDQGGLSGAGVMIQDSKGFIWLGTGRGMYRYDGYNYRLFINAPEHKNNLTLNSISCLYEDRIGKIWIGTSKGPARFDPATETFESFPFFMDRIKAGMTIKSIIEDTAGNIWFTMRTDQDTIGGLVFLDHARSTFEVFNFDGLLYYPSGLSLDEHGNLWIASNNGIFIFDPVGKKLIKHFPSILTPDTEASKSDVSSVYFEKNGVMWATSYKSGVSTIEYGQSYHLSIRNFQTKDGLMTNDIGSMIKDSRGHYWFIATGGIIILNPDKKNIINLRPSKDNKHALKDGWITSLLEDKSGVVWINYNDFGISKVRQNKGFISISNLDGGFEGLSGNKISSVYADPNDNIWLAVAGKGLHKIDFQSDFNAAPLVSFYPQEGRYVNSMEDDGLGNLMMAISNEGVSLLNPATGKIKKATAQGTSMARTLSDGSIFLSDIRRLYKAKKESAKYTLEELIPDSSTRKRRVWPEYSSISRESEHGYWLSTWQGDLYYYNNESNSFTIPVIHPRESLLICDVYVDSKKFLWLTAFEGIFKFKIEHAGDNVKLELIRKYTEKEGFISKSGASEIFTWAMEEDKNGNFWFVGSGLTQLDTKTDKLKHYYESDGVIEASSPMQGSAKLKNGYLVFGTPEGAYMFHPDSLRINTHIPPLEITSITVLNEKSLMPGHEMELDYFENVMSFEFSALDYTDPIKNQYAYQMVGFDPEWINSGNRRTATYTNLNPGTYTFRVKGSNNDGVWNEEGRSLNIIILPPPWRTWWAYLSYGLFLIFLLFVSRNEIIKRERLKAKAKLKELEAEKYQELDSLKSRFFTNISHEFRTPLTLLLGPLEKRLSVATDPVDKTELSIMYRNAARLLALVNQLLELSRLEAGTLKLKARYQSLPTFIQSIASQFSSMADSKTIRFKIEAEKPLSLFFDGDKMEKIITNLLSNAFKFTPPGGAVTLTLHEHSATERFKNGYAEIKIVDSGPGIESEHLGKIFDRFYQADSSSTRGYEGSGIGLALTKELVELHRGSIIVSSERGSGSCFTVLFPMGKEHLQPVEIDPNETTEPHSVSYTDEKSIDEIDQVVEVKHAAHLTTVLIVEDNADLRYYLATNLKSLYKVHEASDGEMGYALALELIPDLILSDLMMPKTDGLQLCKNLKTNEKTSHIPFILLTAKTEIEAKLEGLQLGADDYIAKPFDARELQARINNLIESRKKLQLKFSKQFSLSVTGITVESVEERFLKKVKDTIETNLGDPDFGVENLAEEVAMSHIQVYRKLKALTGQAPNELIRNMRIDRAASLIRQRAGNVSEIAYQVGFNSMSYFAKCFKEKFNVTPSEFANKATK